MIIIHAMNKGILPRFVADSLTDRLRVKWVTGTQLIDIGRSKGS
jgi:hypothetical protein